MKIITDIHVGPPIQIYISSYYPKAKTDCRTINARLFRYIRKNIPIISVNAIA